MSCDHELDSEYLTTTDSAIVDLRGAGEAFCAGADLDVVAAFVVIINGDRGYSLGYDRDGDGWVVVESFEDGGDFAGVTDRLQEWMGDDWEEFAEAAVESE